MVRPPNNTIPAQVEDTREVALRATRIKNATRKAQTHAANKEREEPDCDKEDTEAAPEDLPEELGGEKKARTSNHNASNLLVVCNNIGTLAKNETEVF